MIISKQTWQYIAEDWCVCVCVLYVFSYLVQIEYINIYSTSKLRTFFENEDKLPGRSSQLEGPFEGWCMLLRLMFEFLGQGKDLGNAFCLWMSSQIYCKNCMYACMCVSASSVHVFTAHGSVGAPASASPPPHPALLRDEQMDTVGEGVGGGRVEESGETQRNKREQEGVLYLASSSPR